MSIVDNYRDMEDTAVLELADSLDPVVIRKEVEERFSPEHMVANYVAAYEATIEATRGREAPQPVRPRDRLGLALPALGALAAEPLYLLVDTAIVGHLGRPQLAALGIAITILGGTFAIFNFLQYGTTAQVARAGGAGEERDRAATWCTGGLASLAFGVRCIGAARGACGAARLADGWRGTGGGVRRDVPADRGDRLSGGVSRARCAGVSARAPTFGRRS